MEYDSKSDTDETPIHTDVTHPMPSWGAPVIGLAVVGAAVLIGSVYLWNGMHEKPIELAPQVTRINNEPETPRATADVQILETMSPSDELSAIVADIESTKLDTLDTEMSTIDAELSEFENKIHAP